MGNFVPRPKLEIVQNCTRLDAQVKNKVFESVVEKLLATVNCIKLKGGRGSWNKGGRIELSEVAKLFDDDIKQSMKRECGGLQTLLRNSHQVFLIREGCVELRDWSNLDCQAVGNKRKRKLNQEKNTRKTKACWFDTSHPDGCPRLPHECPFLHKCEFQQIIT